MLLISNTEHNLGMFIEGDYHDFKLLYETLNDITHTGYYRKDAVVENYLYSFLHEVRGAMQGKRELDVFQNNLDEEFLKNAGLADTNIYYGINMFHLDLLFTLMALMHYPLGRISKLHEAYLKLFIELVWNAYKDELEDDDYNKLLALCLPKEDFKDFYHQYIEYLNIQLINSDPSQRLSMLPNALASLIKRDEEYLKVVEEVNGYAKENNCEPIEITYFDSNLKLEW